MLGADLWFHGSKGWGPGKSLEKSEKRGVETASKVTKPLVLSLVATIWAAGTYKPLSQDFATLCQPKYSQRPVALLTHVPHIFRK